MRATRRASRSARAADRLDRKADWTDRERQGHNVNAQPNPRRPRRRSLSVDVYDRLGAKIGMQSVIVHKNELLQTVTANRDGHRALFEEAQVGFRERLIEHLDRMAEDARKGREVEMYINLPVPQDHTKDYDRIIKMVQMSISDEIELSQTEFGMYVMNDFAWRAEFDGTAAAYGVGAPK